MEMQESLMAVIGQVGAWTQLNRRSSNLMSFLQTADLGHHVIEAVSEENTRPRLAQFGTDSFLLILKVLQKDPNSSLQELSTLRIWATSEYLLSFQGKSLDLVANVTKKLPHDPNPAQCLIEILEQSTEILSEFIESLDEECDRIEEILLRRGPERAQSGMVKLRSQILALRRHLIPQKTAVRKLSEICPPWLAQSRYDLQEISSRLDRAVSELEHMRERAVMLQEERENRQNERLNRQLFYLTLLSAIFLPLTFATGLLGVNVSGIPFADRSWAFGGFCLSLFLLFLAQMLFLRWKKWWA